MQHRQRPVAWPLALSLAAHVVLVLLWWRQAPPPAPRTDAAQRASMVWLRLAAAPAAPALTSSPPAASAKSTRRAHAATHPSVAPKRADDTPTVPAASADVMVVTQAAEPVPPPDSPVKGVGFGPPRWSLPFGGTGGSPVFGTRKQVMATPTAVPPTPSAAVDVEPPGAPREQMLRALDAQIASWAAPADTQRAQCRLNAEPVAPDGAEPECDSIAMAQALAERLPMLREALAALRRLGHDVPRSGIKADDSVALVIAFVDGRYRLQMTVR